MNIGGEEAAVMILAIFAISAIADIKIGAWLKRRREKNEGRCDGAG